MLTVNQSLLDSLRDDLQTICSICGFSLVEIIFIYNREQRLPVDILVKAIGSATVFIKVLKTGLFIDQKVDEETWNNIKYQIFLLPPYMRLSKKPQQEGFIVSNLANLYKGE